MLVNFSSWTATMNTEKLDGSCRRADSIFLKKRVWKNISFSSTQKKQHTLLEVEAQKVGDRQLCLLALV